jgi:hypothetical protein
MLKGGKTWVTNLSTYFIRTQEWDTTPFPISFSGTGFRASHELYHYWFLYNSRGNFENVNIEDKTIFLKFQRI